ncbi:MAG: hypothetical protein IKQ10_03735 [Oscillospiraceae bacterium]|nr:hypothetical protein [Oscillospiraceae bacterium]
MAIIMQYGKGTGANSRGTGRKTVLWSNSAPTSSFAAKTVNLSDSVTNYDFLLVVLAFSTGTQDHSTDLIPVDDILGGAEYSLRINAASQNRTGGRSITVPTATTATFGTGAYNGSSSQNGYAIPVAIYGVKL